MTASSPERHWHVRVTLAGDAVEPLIVRSALHRLADERPFLEAMSFTDTTACVEWWDQGETMLDVASLALRFWNEHRESAGLPRWEVVGLEVLEKSLRESGKAGRSLDVGTSVQAPFSF